MKFKVQALVGFLATLLLASPSFANNASAASSTTVVQDPHGDLLYGFVQLARSTSLYDFQDGTRKDGMDYVARFNLNLSKQYLVRVDGSFSQDLNNSDNNDVSDTYISFVRNPSPVGRWVMLGYSLGAVAPTSKDSHTRQNLEGATSAAMIAMINPDRLIPGFAVVGGISIRKNFHSYDTDINGNVNTEYSSAQSISVGYDFASGISLSAQFVHKNGLTYQNNILESFEHSEEIDYGINQNVAIAIGHTNAGSVLKANGVDSNIALIDENASLVYASLTVAF